MTSQKKNLPIILLTNDDGIEAEGLHSLKEALAPHANLFVVAPDREQSSVGLSITIRQPLHIQKISLNGSEQCWKVNGTPADCVKLAISVLLTAPPDLVISGINRGSNAGRGLLYSGTVAGAIEGAIRGIPSLAISCYDYFNPDYETAKPWMNKILSYITSHSLPPGTFLNINFPPRAQTLKGFKMTKSGLSYWKENPDHRHHPNEGHSYYWLGAQLAEFEEEEDCDISWLAKGYACAVPIHINQLADQQLLNEKRPHFESFF